MPYIPLSDNDRARILEAIGLKTVEELFTALPAASRVKGPLNLPKGLTEQELMELARKLARKNSSVEDFSSFLGAGAYNHYIPSVVRHLASRSEFYTAYTPYQPEISQGTLQAMFEYQTLVCQLTGMDVSNASLYDGASATAEAALMAGRLTGKKKVVLSGALHPEYRETIKTYLAGSAEVLSEAAFCAETGTTLPASIEAACDDNTACVVIQSPNFFGSIEDVERIASVAHARGALVVAVVTEPVSLGILKPPAASGADIVVGENQSFGNPLNFGGPHLGFMATRTEFIRQMPGRIIGETVDREGQRAYCLTFATREQHIRRERATSNICTNQGLCALTAAIHMVSLGAAGLKKLATLNLSKAEYLKGRLTKIEGVKVAFTGPTFNEFAIDIGRDPAPVLKKLLEKKIIGGLALKRFYPALDRHILVAATEMNGVAELDAFADALAGVIL